MPGLGDSCKGSQRGRKLTAINPFSIAAHIQNMFVVTEFATPHDPMDFFRRPVSLGIRSISRIARVDCREERSRVVKEFDNFEERRRRRERVGSEVCLRHRTGKVLHGIGQGAKMV